MCVCRAGRATAGAGESQSGGRRRGRGGPPKSFGEIFGHSPCFRKVAGWFDVDYIAAFFSSARPSPPQPAWCSRIVFEREEAFLKWWVMDCLNPSGTYWAGVFEAAHQ